MAGTVGACLAEAARRLEGVSESPRLDAELLLAHCLGISRSKLLARTREAAALPPHFEACMARRLAHEPVAYILGHQEFFGLSFAVHAPILCPRPETEHLVEGALAHLTGQAAPRVLDLCCGSGCVGIAIARHLGGGAVLTATDLNPAACTLTRRNAAALGVAATVLEGDLFAALGDGTAAFDAIVSNPPYVEAGAWDGLARDIRDHEDRGALVAGEDGLDLLRRIIDAAPAWLRPGGWLALEMGESQYPAVAGLLEARGFAEVRPRLDLAGIRRIGEAVWPGTATP